MIHNLKPYVPALVNEALGEHYTDKALVTLKAGKEVQSIMGGYIIKTDIDEAMEKTEEQVSVSYTENVMNSLKCTARQAMEILRISPEKQKRYKRLLKKAANGAV